MRVSIVTVTYNSAATLKDTLESVRDQTYNDIEHILVDGGSSDATVQIIKSYPHVKKWVSEKDRGLYDAINKGIRMAAGDVVGVLHSDDFFPDKQVVSKIADAFQKTGSEAIYGDIAFVSPQNVKRIVRFYSSKGFKPARFAYGYMPAHPSFYAKREIFTKYGLYKLDYKIAADYEMLMRLMYKHKISCSYLPLQVVHMRTGGVSNKTIMSRYLLNKEIIKACQENGVSTNMAILTLKYVRKVFEFIKPALKGSGK